MRVVQTVLLFVGATALGSAWGCIAIALLGALTVFRARSGEDWGTAFGVIFSGACFGLPLGGLVGIGAAKAIASGENEDWSPIVWLGVALGVAMGPVSCYLGASQLRFDVVSTLIAVIATATFGTIGGLLAAAGEGLWRRASRGRSQLARIVAGLVIGFCAVSLMLGLASLLFSRRLTEFQLAMSFLFGIPVLCGLVTWLRHDRQQTRVGKRTKRRNRVTFD